MTHTITLIPGDGTGPEIAEATRRVLEATGVSIEWDVQHAGSDMLEREGTPLPDRVIESIRRNRVAIKGPVTTPVGTGFRSVNVALRKTLNLYACVRPCKTYPGVLPMFHLDHIYVAGGLKVEKVSLPRTKLTLVASDHLPLVADVLLPS